MKKTLLAIFAFTSILAQAQTSEPVKFSNDKNHSSITYSMNHLLHAWTGESKTLNSIIISDSNKTTISQVTVSVKVASFDSKNANRDSQMIKVTEATKYPAITFQSTKIKAEANKLTVTGTLQFHGISKIITFQAIKKQLEGNKIEITGGFEVKMTEFKIKQPSLMGIKADDEIKINFNVQF